MHQPIVYGPAYSTYVRTVCLALIEKGVAFERRDVDILSGAAQSPEYLRRHPFGKVPAFEHDGFAFYETGAITSYVDEAFSGAPLQPADLRQRARMRQLIGVVDSYGYGAMIGSVVMQRLVAPLLGNAADEAVIAAALPMCEKVLRAIDELTAGQPFLAGPALSLADLYLVPVLDYFLRTPEGQQRASLAPGLEAWWSRISHRPSVIATRPDLG